MESSANPLRTRSQLAVAASSVAHNDCRIGAKVWSWLAAVIDPVISFRQQSARSQRALTLSGGDATDAGAQPMSDSEEQLLHFPFVSREAIGSWSTLVLSLSLLFCLLYALRSRRRLSNVAELPGPRGLPLLGCIQLYLLPYSCTVCTLFFLMFYKCTF